MTRRRVFLDLAPLRASESARWLYAGLAITWLGRQITVVAVPFQVYDLTRSSLAVGLLGLAQVVPTILASLAGGAVADALDRRRLLALAQVGLCATALLLALNAVLDRPLLWPLYVLTALNASLQAIDAPARSAALPAIVGRALLPQAVAMVQTIGNVAKSVGPIVAGVLLARTTLGVTYLVEAAVFVVGLVLIVRIRPLPPEGGGRRVEWSSIAQGFAYVRRRRILKANFGIDLNAMVFGMPTALFPAFALEHLGGDAATVGLLYAAPGVGALVAALLSGWVGGVRRQGRAVVLAVAGWGAAIASFGLSRSVPLAVGFLALAGAADVISTIFRGTIMQLAVPDDLRGRLFGIHVAAAAGGPRLGDLEAGAVASVTSAPFSIVSGGVACLVGAAVIARLVPEYLAYGPGAAPRDEEATVQGSSRGGTSG